jgi:HSP20 family protein
MAEKKNPASEATSGRTSESVTGRTSGDAAEIDPIIASLERVYQSLTGTSPPPPGEDAYAPIPIERDPGEYVSQRFEKLLEALQQPPAAGSPSWSPPLTVWESAAEVVVCIDLPGVPRQDVELALESDVLTVRGRRPIAHDSARLRMQEGPLGPFERRILLPQRVDRTEPSARLEDGVLEIRLGKLHHDAATGRREIRVS